MMSGHYRYTLIAYGLQRELLYCTAIAAGAAVFLGLTLTPMLGATGAALALLLANVLNFRLVYCSVRKHIVRIRIRRQMPYPALAMGVSSVVFFLLSRHMNIWLAYGATAVVFGGIMLAVQAPHVANVVRMIAAKRQGGRAVKESWAR
jgi:O-antigen/teichoic acid export membrane protein